MGPTHDDTSADHPQLGAEVGRCVAGPPGASGRVVRGSGIGIGITANNVAGVRCALVHDTFTAEVARLHSDANSDPATTKPGG